MSENTAADRLRTALTDASFEHRVRTVVHRWYTCYETERKNLAHHGELLTPGFVLHRAPESGLPDVAGRQAYLDGLPHAYPGQANAHHLRGIELTPADDTTVKAVVTHDFETRGPSLDGAAVIRYDFELVRDATEWLPRITTFTEQVVSRHEAPFTEAYGENRVRAFLHYWLSLLEQPAADAEPLRELIADDLEMTLSDGRVLRTFEEVSAWYAGARDLVDVSIHHVHDLTVTPGADRTHDLTMEFAWQGIAKSGRPMTARTRHAWTLTETDERYLRLSRFHVTALAPFAPVTAEEALAHFQAARRPA
ncbi:hypothetical protein [Streptomyces sp. NPDC037389]|uniref:hypothetical protein n=1 Tax=Streptomyces sp. NPDC037389 TaxID=3155369 RepID=UPI0033CC31C9